MNFIKKIQLKFENATLYQKVVVYLITIPVLYIIFYALATNYSENVFEFNHTGIVWISFLLITGSFVLTFRVKSIGQRKILLTIKSIEEDSKIVIFKDEVGCLYRISLNLIPVLEECNFVKQIDEFSYEMRPLDTFATFLLCINRINSLDSKLTKKQIDNDNLVNTVYKDILEIKQTQGEQIQGLLWVKKKLGYNSLEGLIEQMK